MESNSESECESVVSHARNSDDAKETSRPILLGQAATKDISETDLNVQITTAQQVSFQN
jgi:hypothetical protein